MPEPEINLLNQKIVSLPFSKELKEMLLENEIQTLGELLQFKACNGQHALNGFNNRSMHEVVSFLLENDLMKFVKEE